ncbi:MAG: HlyD family efflux transporter periplasmic adaptor subunit [Prolixibacteraceae bacterium]|jgi:biotin carboxyl carrier protein|nr:HlyD family efflux transporter periplasmic adaptor subunit [Prolixibacteraceae bacterium]
MSIEIKTQNRTASVNLVHKDGTLYTVEVDGVQYEVDIAKTGSSSYSTILNGKSTDIDLTRGHFYNHVHVHTRNNDFDVEIIDEKARYLAMAKSESAIDETIISSPMPGKVVRVDKKEGQEVVKGETLIVVAAMKMESEYKSPVDGVVYRINVKVNDNIQGGEPLVEVKPKNK